MNNKETESKLVYLNHEKDGKNYHIHRVGKAVDFVIDLTNKKMEAKTSLINDENIDVTERVNNGFTKVFDTYREAYTYAQSKGGYVYEIRLKKEFNHKLITYKFFGYGVPK